MIQGSSKPRHSPNVDPLVTRRPRCSRSRNADVWKKDDRRVDGTSEVTQLFAPLYFRAPQMRKPSRSGRDVVDTRGATCLTIPPGVMSPMKIFVTLSLTADLVPL